jgi:hypothetical protein
MKKMRSTATFYDQQLKDTSSRKKHHKIKVANLTATLGIWMVKKKATL